MFLRSTLINLHRITRRNVIRTCTHQVTSQPTQPAQSSPDWNTIYKLPVVTNLAKLSKLKIVQAALTVTGAPVVFGLNSLQMIETQTAEVFAIIGITGTITFTLYSLCVTNVIGFVYVNPVLKKIRFAYIDFWGRRKNLDLTLDELVSSDQKRAFKTYTVVKTTTAAGSFKLLKYGTVLNGDMFCRLFGDLDE